MLFRSLGLSDAYMKLIEELNRSPKPYNVPVAALALSHIELARGHTDNALGWVEYGRKAIPTKSPELFYQKGLCLEQLRRYAEARAAYGEIPSSSLAFDRAQVRLKRLP